MMDVLFELPDALRRERMAHCLPFPGVFCTIPRVEKSTLDANESIVVLALQESISVPVDLRNRVRICDANVVRLYTHEFSILGMCGVYSEIAFSLTALSKEPEVREGGGEGRGDVADLPVSDVWEEVVEDW